MSWKFESFGSLFEYENKSKIKAGDGMLKGNHPFFTSSTEQSKYLDIYSYNKKSLIFGTGGNPSIHYCDIPFSVSTDCLVSFPKDTSLVYPKYVYYYISGNIHLLEKGFKGAGLKHISKTYINEIPIPLPPLHIQVEIANTLDKADALRRKDQELLNKYDELAQAIFYDMFGDTLLNDKKWVGKNVSELITFMTSGSRGWATYYSETGELFLRINNVKNATLFLDDVVYVNPPDTAESKRTLVKPRDVLLSITADLGRTAVVPDTIKKAYINQHLALLRLNNKINPYYLAHFMNSRGGQEQIRKGNKGGVKAGLNFNDIKELSILVPPTQLQNEFENAIKKLRVVIDVHKKNSSLPINLFNTLSIKYFS